MVCVREEIYLLLQQVEHKAPDVAKSVAFLMWEGEGISMGKSKKDS